MIWRDKERSWIRPVKMDNLRGLFVIRRMDKVPNEIGLESCLVCRMEWMKGLTKVFFDGSAILKE